MGNFWNPRIEIPNYAPDWDVLAKGVLPSTG